MEAHLEYLSWRVFRLCMCRAPMPEVVHWSNLMLKLLDMYAIDVTPECQVRLALAVVAQAVVAATRTGQVENLPMLVDCLEAFDTCKKLCDSNEETSFFDKMLHLRIQVSIFPFLCV